MSDRRDLPAELVAAARAWIEDDPDPATRQELADLLDRGDEAALRERFAHPVSFGTAGLRAPLGAGPARMNRLVVRQTTAGVARWLLEQDAATVAGGLVVGRDARHGSEVFASDVVEVAAELGLRVLELERPLPTPITAFAVRHFRAGAGVMITASHNPAPDNGYKVFATDGAQILPPDAERIADGAARSVLQRAGRTGALADAGPSSGDVVVLGERELLDAYASAVLPVLSPGGPRQLRIVYTPIHGVGGAVLPRLLERAGFDAPEVVASQAEPDPDFPTALFPSPEEPGVLDPAIAVAEHLGADLVLANDPDADRLAVAVPEPGRARWRVLSGDEVGALLGDHLVSVTSGANRLVATTIVSSSLLAKIAGAAGVAYAETLTGFKWIARAATGLLGKRLIFGYEEALGYAVSDAVHDKDGLSAGLVVAELAARAKAEGQALTDRLDELAVAFGVHATSQWSLRVEPSDGAALIAAIVERWLTSPPSQLAGLALSQARDLGIGTAWLPPTTGVLLRFEGDAVTARVVVRPSGTEPKLKAYLEVVTAPPGEDGLGDARRAAAERLAALSSEVEAALSP